jgi:hypothetical protein
MQKDRPDYDRDIGTPDEPGGPGRTEYPMPEPREGDIYVPKEPDHIQN